MGKTVEHFDVVQIGYGPVGQALAALLGAQGWKVGVFERHNALYRFPRAGHFDHEVARILQGIGALEEIIDKVVVVEAYSWFNQHRELLLNFKSEGLAISGWSNGYMFYQPYLEAALNNAVAKNGSALVEFGWQAVGLYQHSDYVEIALRPFSHDSGANDSEGEPRLVRARYVVAADGANSFARNALGITLEDFGFKEQWLVLDLRLKQPIDPSSQEVRTAGSYQVCDPARPMMTAMLSAEVKRFGFMRMPRDPDGYLEKPETAWSLIRPWATPDTADLIRNVVYQFRSAMARQWRMDRVILAGDAVHLMPPFMGQGMCAGIRDAANLAWKLDLVLGGCVHESLLATYETERRPHVKAYIDLSVHVGKISCTTDVAEAAVRDATLMAGGMAPPPTPPCLEEGALQGGRAGARPIGSLGPQGHICVGNRCGLADDVLGHGRWQLISRRDPRGVLSAFSRTFAEELDIACLWFGDGGAEDLNGAYKKWFDQHDIEAVLVRPDFYIFGVAKSAAHVNGLMRELWDRIGWKDSVVDHAVARRS